ncbi:hypothetical protein [Bradyrhizobium japonicum]|uniref:hypothetical protein n=1 Tax=Bradyrhizobium japonicum TaxID=375 RepID=UPI001BAC9BCD|nr:hypothetical protein [Bradyrhizobium japonicum]MBR0915422.1 hypothetical protein [Bradyrhizobium japonicum]
MLDVNLARIRAHRNNIHRYQRLLRTKLSELERRFVEGRLADEQAALDALAAETFPIIRPSPSCQSASPGLRSEL